MRDALRLVVRSVSIDMYRILNALRIDSILALSSIFVTRLIVRNFMLKGSNEILMMTYPVLLGLTCDKRCEIIRMRHISYQI